MNIREPCSCESGKRLRNTVRIGKQEEVNVLFNMNNKKTRKIFSTIVIVLVVSYVNSMKKQEAKTNG